MSNSTTSVRPRNTAKALWTIVGLAITAFIGPALAPFITDWIRDNVETQGVSAFWLALLRLALLTVSALGVLALILSALIPGWRRRLWKPALSAIAAAWPVTRARHAREIAAADEAGYSRRSEEVAAERAQAPKPTLSIDQRGPDVDKHIFKIRNHGYPVNDVRIEADPLEATMRAPAFWPGVFGSKGAGSISGHFFEADLSESAIENGVTFRVSYSDQNGDHRTEAITLSPDQFFKGRKESPEEAYERGRADLQAEIDAAREKPIRHPRWVISAKPNGKPGEYILLNADTTSVAQNIAIDAPSSEFMFLSAANWDDLNNEAGGALFLGRLTDGGAHFGVNFTVEWDDINGDRRTSTVPLLTRRSF